VYDVSKLKTLEECRTVMKRAKERGNQEIYSGAFR
jgi:hypothetical protein